MYRQLQYIFLFFIWYPFRSILRWFTTKRGSYNLLFKVGDFLGNLLYLCFPTGRRLMKEQLIACRLYESGVVRKGFQHMMKTEMEGMVFEDLNPNVIKKITVFYGLHHLDQCLKGGRGAILTLFHLGWHMHTIPALGYTGYRIKQLADEYPVDLDRDFGYFRRMVIKKRLKNAANLPAEVLHTGNYIRPIIRALEQNDILICAIDGREGRNLERYNFLGRKILISPVIFSLAIKTRSPVLPMVTYRGKDGKHRIIVHPPIKHDSPEKMINRCLAVYEYYITKQPHQYAHYLLINALGLGRKEKGGSALFES
jgi:lauroyl/myristoyl acyltransferase